MNIGQLILAIAILSTSSAWAVLFPSKPIPLSAINIDLDFEFSEEDGAPINQVDLHCPQWPQGIDCINRQQMMTLYKVDVFNNDPHSFKNLPILTIINHATTAFDAGSSTFPAARRLLSFSIQAGVPRMGIISTNPEFGIGTQVFQQKHVNYVVESQGGQHNLQFPQTGTFLIAGGNLSFCLCDFLRDAIHGTTEYAKTNSKPIDFIFLSDGIYDDSTSWPTELASPFTQDELDIIEDGGQIQFLLSSLLEKSTGTPIFLHYMEKTILGLGTEFCPRQNFSNHPPIDSSHHTFHIYLSDNGKIKKLKTFGDKGRQFNFIFTMSQELIPTLKSANINI